MPGGAREQQHSYVPAKMIHFKTHEVSREIPPQLPVGDGRAVVLQPRCRAGQNLAGNRSGGDAHGEPWEAFFYGAIEGPR